MAPRVVVVDFARPGGLPACPPALSDHYQYHQSESGVKVHKDHPALRCISAIARGGPCDMNNLSLCQVARGFKQGLSFAPEIPEGPTASVLLCCCLSRSLRKSLSLSKSRIIKARPLPPETQRRCETGSPKTLPAAFADGDTMAMRCDSR
jgi:hypothetical protein